MIEHDRKNASLRFFLGSDKDFREKLVNKKLEGKKLFSGRKVKIRNAYTLCDRLLELFYLFTCNIEGVKRILRYHNKEYLTRKCLKFYSVKEISSENYYFLRRLIENSETFEARVKKVYDVSEGDLIKIRREVQCQRDFIDRASEDELLDVADFKFSKKHFLSPDLPFKVYFLKTILNNRLYEDLQENEKRIFGLLESCNKHLLTTEKETINYYEHLLKFKDLPENSRIVILKRLFKTYERACSIDYKKLEYVPDKKKAIECCEELLKTLVSPDKRHRVLKFLISLYYDEKMIDKVIACLGKFYFVTSLYFQNIRDLAEKCKNEKNYEGAIQCYEYLVNQPDLEPKKRISILYKLSFLYSKLSDNEGALSCFERIVNLPEADFNEKFNALGNLAEYDEDVAHQISYHERVLLLPEGTILHQYDALCSLSYIYNTQDNITEQINCHLRGLKLFTSSELDNKEEMEATVLDKLILLYYRSENTAKVIECYQHKSKLEKINRDKRVEALRELCTLYKKADNNILLIETLTRLAQLYLADKESTDAAKLAIDCYKEILEIPNLTETQKIEAFTQLTSIQESIKDTKNEIQYIKQLLEKPETSQLSLFLRSLLNRLTIIYKDKKKPQKEIFYYNWILKIPDLPVEVQRQSLKRTIEIYVSLDLFKTVQIKLNEQLLEISKWPEYKDQYDILKRLATLYNRTSNTAFEIKTYERILKLPNIETKIKIETLISLALLYKNVENISMAMSCYKSIFQMPEASWKHILDAIENWLKLCSGIDVSTVEGDLSSVFATLESSRRFCLSKSQFECYVLIFNKFPELTLPYLNKLGQCFRQIGYFDDNYDKAISNAIECYERILRIEDLPINDQIKALKRLASCHSEKGDEKKVIETHIKLIAYKELSLHDQYNSYTSLAKAYAGIKKRNKAMACYEYILTNLNSILHAEYEALTNLADIYRQTRRSPLAIICYERIIASENTDEDEKIAALKKMASLCSSIDNVEKEIWCYENLINSEVTSEDDKREWLEAIIYIYKQINNIETTIEGFERILKLPNITTKIKRIVLEQLSVKYAKIENEIKQLECYQLILKLPDICQSIQFETYEKLINIYSRNKDIPKVIECHESILKLERLEEEDKINSLKVLSLLYCQINNTGKEFDILSKLSNLYSKKIAPRNEVDVLESILEIPDLNDDNCENTLYRLGELYLELDNELKAIDILERYLKITKLSPLKIIPIINNLGDLYRKNENHAKAVECYERILSILDEIQFDEKTLTSNNIQPIQILEYLETYYSENNHVINAIKCSEIIIKLTTINDAEHLKHLIKLESLYSKIDYRNQILYNELILKYPNLSRDVKSITLVNLIELYLKDDNFNKARDYHYEIEKLGRKEFLDTLLIFLNHPKFGLSENVRSLLFGGSEYYNQKIINLLASYYWLWSDVVGKPKKLTNDQWLTVLGKTNIPSELECIALQPCISVTGLHKDYFLNDPTMGFWNILTQRPRDINDSDWDIIKVTLTEMNSEICGENDNQEQYLLKFLNQCMASRDAMTSLGKQFIRKRIASVVDYLVDLKQSANQNNWNTRTFKDALSIMKVGGMGCPDRAVTFIVYLEGYIKLIKNPEYLPNVMVQLFKFEAISRVLVPEVDGDIIEVNGKIMQPKEKENIESYLFYILALNKILNLGLPENGTMLYPGVAKVVPLEFTIEPLSHFFTQAQLIDFTTKHILFKSRFENEKENALIEKREEFALAFDDLIDLTVNTPPYNAQKIKVDQLEQDLKNMEKTFYCNKAKELFEGAGFLSEL